MSVPAAGDAALHALCNSRDLTDGGMAVPFDVSYAGQTCRAFAIRYRGHPHAYLNRCAHVAMEMDWQPDRFFDDSGRWLLCATHGAVYEPDTGACKGGPCRGGLVKIDLKESDGVVHWRSQYPLCPVEF
ncbi:nitrite reductase/ring-hydroxylating ferredoxin subunit [Hydrogenophaga palleronii]|uniref:Nitrite reductase/ring-hydroxylating ferredoxin subunit n=1 Tax=Hydrogenophaga palleronii TaxID=65655 RepID=A0ABU1WPJ4_9BURK|nr:Rieske 2Fe-2S domain-containing protein [Hydrogenophaga palleronii]MDR7151198.1 nitrite reductase/ring-hydroxylating ferredoxin subunit [Hydrogenophaga palleronii]